MDKPFSAYDGTDGYIFACYAHKDAESVYADLVMLKDAGINIWYDEGIPAGTAWRGEIANAIKNADKLVYFISASSLKSNHCLREVDYALSHDIEIIPVYLSEEHLPPELDLVLGRVQGVYRNRDARYMERLQTALKASGPSTLIGTRSGKKKQQAVILFLLASIIAISATIWYRGIGSVSTDRAQAGLSTQPGAYDVYLEGLDLIGRWAQQDNLDRAIDLFRQAVARDPGFALGYARLAEALRIKYAATQVPQWLDEARENTDRALDLNPDLAPVQVVSGRIQTMQGNYDLAFDALQQALAIDPNDALANQAIAALYNQLGRDEDAEQYFKRAVTLEPDNLFILDSYGNYFYNHGNFEEAIRQWQKIVTLAPDYFSAILNLGSALLESGRVSEAITMFRRANEIQPSYMAYTNLGTAYGRSEQYPDAIAALQQAIELSDSDPLAWANLAYVYTWAGMDDLAQDSFKQAISLAENQRQPKIRDPYIHSSLALYYAHTGQADLALQRLDTAMTLSADDPYIHADAAEVYRVLGQEQMARTFIQSALELGFPRQQFLRSPELADLMTDLANE